jgi:envelope integrity protein A
MRMRAMSALATIAALGFVLNVAQAEDKPDATIKLSGGSVAAGVGYSWGSGTLHYKGKNYPIEVSGLSVGDVGATKIKASGKVYNLKKLDDFDGNYTAATAGMTVAGGASATAMKNQNGVTINLVSTTQGLKFALAASGVSMKIKK